MGTFKYLKGEFLIQALEYSYKFRLHNESRLSCSELEKD